MISFIFQSIVMMLSGILIYEISKFLWNHLTEYRIKRECEHYENREFRKEIQKAFKKLEKEYEKEMRA